MIQVHDSLLSHPAMYAQGATGDWGGLDGAYCIDAPDTHPAGSTRRVDPQDATPFAMSRHAYRPSYK